jgi:hypothetical protein
MEYLEINNECSAEDLNSFYEGLDEFLDKKEIDYLLDLEKTSDIERGNYDV